VTLLGGSKSGTGSLAEHKFTKIKLDNGSSGWISTKFLKTAPCVAGNSLNAGSIPGSVLHFTGDRPGVLAMLDAIAYSEFRNSPEATSARAYNLLFGHRFFSSFARHPDTVICQDLCSAAAGRYQFMPVTWEESQNYIANNTISEIPWMRGRLPDFSPASQDKMAIYKIWYRFAYGQLRTLSQNDNVTLKSTTAKLAPEWASLPGDFHGQGGVKWEEFKQFFWKRYTFYNK
jgi:muramidase (phage lysozyme)